VVFWNLVSPICFAEKLRFFREAKANIGMQGEPITQTSSS
jgi:hypothetical protein